MVKQCRKGKHMSKKNTTSRLTKTQGYAILWMLEQGKTDTDIMQELKISEASLKRFVEKNKPTNKQADIKTVTSSTQNKAKDLMISQTSQKSNSGVSIMTKESSEVADEYRKKARSEPKDTSDHIFKPNG